MLTPKTELDFRRRWYQVHLHRFRGETKDGEGREMVQQEPPGEVSAIPFLEFITGEAPLEGSEEYEDLLLELGADPERFKKVAAWWSNQKPIVVDPVLLDRCAWRFPYQGRGFEEDLPDLRVNSRALMRVEQHIGALLDNEALNVSQQEMTLVFQGVNWPKFPARGHLQITWQVPEQYGPGLWIWANKRGMTICLAPGIGPHRGKGGERRWYDGLIEVLPDGKDSDFGLIGVGGGRGDDRGFMGRIGSSVYGRWYERDQLEGMDLKAEFRKVVSQLRPVLDRWMEVYDRAREGTVVEDGTANRVGGEPRLDDLAKELLVKREDLDEIIVLLRDKGQVILYGPPGTGKTYLAKKLAECLAPEDSQRAFVQFHPSMSYEDFFEGYRPYTSEDGSMTYRLASGPLRAIAGRAAEDPEKLHIMIIDEINRANLPRVLGELLFLLEYRKETVLPLYRPDEPFQLPKNLWLIGTMNTADRSIALVDAALRRRFHFVPFFPHYGLVDGLLERWLDKKRESPWVGKLVAEVNKQLTEALGGPHLQLGHSHFIKEGISDLKTGKFEMVWKYTVEPFIEEQFFDDPNRIESFRCGRVLRDHGPSEDGLPEGDQTAHGE